MTIMFDSATSNGRNFQWIEVMHKQPVAFGGLGLGGSICFEPADGTVEPCDDVQRHCPFCQA